MEFKIVFVLLSINTLIIVTTIVVRSIMYVVKRKINDYRFYHEYVFGDGWKDPLLFGGITRTFWFLFIIEAILIGLSMIPIIITLLF